MVNIYLFIELIRAASAPDVADRIKGMSLANCKFANVVVLSYDKLVAQLDCSTPERMVGTLRFAHPTRQSRSTRPFTPSCLAQWTQQ